MRRIAINGWQFVNCEVKQNNAPPFKLQANERKQHACNRSRETSAGVRTH